MFSNSLAHVKSVIDEAQRDIIALPDSQEKAFALIHLSQLRQELQKPPPISPTEPASDIRLASNFNGKPHFSRGIRFQNVTELAKHRDKKSLSPKQKTELRLQSYNALKQAEKIAQSSQDKRTLSYVNGQLAQLYADEQRYNEAIRLTKRAILYAQPCREEGIQLTGQAIFYAHPCQEGVIQIVQQSQPYPHLLYRWEWELGRLLKITKQFDTAINAYQWAIKRLEDIRGKLDSGYRNTSQPFRETDGRVYFEFADLLLEQAKVAKSISKRQQLRRQARESVESFKVAELENYLQNECITKFQARNIDENLPPNTAVFYPIVLADRIELLLSVGQEIQQFTVDMSNDIININDDTVDVHRELLSKINQFRVKLEIANENLQEDAQQIYNWFIKPIENALSSHDIKTLVIVPDGILRTIPFAALFYGQNYLIERYAIATTPSMKLVEPTRFWRDNLRILAFGLSEKMPKEFPKLFHVKTELHNICEEFGGQGLCDDILMPKKMVGIHFRGGKILTEQQFTFRNAMQELSIGTYPIVHFATHGSFESNAEDSFLLTYREHLKMDQLKKLVGLREFSQPVELLTLSACQTAKGDEQAALGLAGIAIKAGARSALASLWSVSDAAIAELMIQFYRHLKNPNLSKAQALQEAQKYLLQKTDWKHPNYWAAFLLIGNWL